MKHVLKHTKDITVSEVYEGHYLAESKHWQCEIDKRIPLAIYVEITNMDDATGEPEFADYPYLVGFQIVAAKPAKSFYEGSGKPDRLSTIADCVSYMGGVPIDHKLLNIDSINDEITGELNAKTAKLVTHSQDFGTLAAQEGKGAKITYPQFKNADDALAWAESMINRYADAVMGLVGFTLDQPINMMGENGWSVIEHQVNGRK